MIKNKLLKSSLGVSLFIIIIYILFNPPNEFNITSDKIKDNNEKIESSNTNTEEKNNKKSDDNESNNNKLNNMTNITINSLGDCTLGSFPEVVEGKSFHDVLKKNNYDYEYPFKNAFKWIKSDDITLINFEGTLTDSEVMANKRWRFKGPKDYTNILTESSVEVVNLANNHTYDYLEKGYNDTIEALTESKIGVSDEEHVLIKDVRGVKIAFIGYLAKDEPKDIFNKVEKSIKQVKEDGASLIITSFHWGTEYNYNPTEYQKKLGRFAIDVGSDMVIGHHPHVLQGIEKYKNRYIAYSLGNFVFGGNEILYDEKHKDTDTILLKQEIKFINNEVSDIELSIVPFDLSGDTEYNNYQPIVQSGEEGLRIRDKIIRISEKLDYGIKELNILKK